jgi:hypothetical protein
MTAATSSTSIVIAIATATVANCKGGRLVAGLHGEFYDLPDYVRHH